MKKLKFHFLLDLLNLFSKLVGKSNNKDVYTVDNTYVSSYICHYFGQNHYACLKLQIPTKYLT